VKKIILLSLVTSSLLFSKTINVFDSSELINKSVITKYVDKNEAAVIKKNIEEYNKLIEKINEQILKEASNGADFTEIELFEVDPKVRKILKDVYYKPVFSKLNIDLLKAGYKSEIVVKKGQRLRKTYILKLSWKNSKKKIRESRSKQSLSKYLEYFKI